MDWFKVYQMLQIGLGFFWWTLLGQGVLFLFTGRYSQNNVVFQLMVKINRPVTWISRAITPRFIVDRHIGFIAFALVTIARLAVHAVFFRMGALPDFTPVGG